MYVHACMCLLYLCGWRGERQHQVPPHARGTFYRYSYVCICMCADGFCATSYRRPTHPNTPVHTHPISPKQGWSIRLIFPFPPPPHIHTPTHIYSYPPKQEWFVRLGEEPQLPRLPRLFKPILHIILLVWKNSAHYNTPARSVFVSVFVSARWLVGVYVDLAACVYI